MGMHVFWIMTLCRRVKASDFALRDVGKFYKKKTSTIHVFWEIQIVKDCEESVIIYYYVIGDLLSRDWRFIIMWLEIYYYVIWDLLLCDWRFIIMWLEIYYYVIGDLLLCDWRFSKCCTWNLHPHDVWRPVGLKFLPNALQKLALFLCDATNFF
jgi:hypothetical protein